MNYNMNFNAEYKEYLKERPLDPPDDVIDYDNSEELIEQERADAADKAVWEALWGKDLDALTELLKGEK